MASVLCKFCLRGRIRGCRRLLSMTRPHKDSNSICDMGVCMCVYWDSAIYCEKHIILFHSPKLRNPVCSKTSRCLLNNVTLLSLGAPVWLLWWHLPTGRTHRRMDSSEMERKLSACHNLSKFIDSIPSNEPPKSSVNRWCSHMCTYCLW